MLIYSKATDLLQFLKNYFGADYPEFSAYSNWWGTPPIIPFNYSSITDSQRASEREVVMAHYFDAHQL